MKPDQRWQITTDDVAEPEGFVAVEIPLPDVPPARRRSAVSARTLHQPLSHSRVRRIVIVAFVIAGTHVVDVVTSAPPPDGRTASASGWIGSEGELYALADPPRVRWSTADAGERALCEVMLPPLDALDEWPELAGLGSALDGFTSTTERLGATPR